MGFCAACLPCLHKSKYQSMGAPGGGGGDSAHVGELNVDADDLQSRAAMAEVERVPMNAVEQLAGVDMTNAVIRKKGAAPVAPTIGSAADMDAQLAAGAGGGGDGGSGDGGGGDGGDTDDGADGSGSNNRQLREKQALLASQPSEPSQLLIKKCPPSQIPYFIAGHKKHNSRVRNDGTDVTIALNKEGGYFSYKSRKASSQLRAISTAEVDYIEPAVYEKAGGWMCLLSIHFKPRTGKKPLLFRFARVPLDISLIYFLRFFDVHNVTIRMAGTGADGEEPDASVGDGDRVLGGGAGGGAGGGVGGGGGGIDGGVTALVDRVLGGGAAADEEGNAAHGTMRDGGSSSSSSSSSSSRAPGDDDDNDDEAARMAAKKRSLNQRKSLKQKLREKYDNFKGNDVDDRDNDEFVEYASRDDYGDDTAAGNDEQVSADDQDNGDDDKQRLTGATNGYDDHVDDAGVGVAYDKGAQMLTGDDDAD